MKTEFTTPLTTSELSDLRRAKMLLENPGLTSRLANLVGGPLERGFNLLPADWSARIHQATQGALMKALSISVVSLGGAAPRPAVNRFHKLLAGATGGIGGFLGMPSLPLELPVSTAIMLRSIADVARSEGHGIYALQDRLSCLEVFALGGRGDRAVDDDAADNAYWMLRAGLSHALTNAAVYVARKGFIAESAPAVVRLISTIAARFSIVISEQVAAKAVPIVGAAAGSTINILFMDHFQNLAKGHFIVKRLEKAHGTDTVRGLYQSIAMPMS